MQGLQIGPNGKTSKIPKSVRGTFQKIEWPTGVKNGPITVKIENRKIGQIGIELKHE